VWLIFVELTCPSWCRPPTAQSQVDRQAEDEEKKKMAEATWVFDGHPRKFREIVSRRKKKKGEWHRLGGLC